LQHTTGSVIQLRPADAADHRHRCRTQQSGGGVISALLPPPTTT
jgi:hypothetical protein